MTDTIARLKCFAPSVPVVGLKRSPEPGAFKPIAELLLGEQVA
jgi:hypothetical protein